VPFNKIYLLLVVLFACTRFTPSPGAIMHTQLRASLRKFKDTKRSALREFESARPPARQAFLDDLLTRLTPWEWRALQEKVSAHRFQYDIIGNLPTELVHHIASYLKHYEIVALRRVCKRWRELLMAEELCRKVCLQNGFSVEPRLPGTMTWEYLLCYKSCKRKSLVQGRPWSKATYYEHASEDIWMRDQNYHNGKLAFARFEIASGKPEAINIIHFDSGNIVSLPVYARGPVRAMGLSDLLFSCVLDQYDHPLRRMH
jgi:F-box-like